MWHGLKQVRCPQWCWGLTASLLGGLGQPGESLEQWTTPCRLDILQAMAPRLPSTEEELQTVLAVVLG